MAKKCTWHHARDQLSARRAFYRGNLASVASPSTLQADRCAGADLQGFESRCGVSLGEPAQVLANAAI